MDDYDVFAEPVIRKKPKPVERPAEQSDQAPSRTDQLNNIKCPIPKINVQQVRALLCPNADLP